MMKLVCGDAIEEMEKMEDGSVNVVATSPPYNLGKDYGECKDSLESTKYLEWTAQWVSQINRVLKDDGSFFFNVSGKPSRPWLPYEVLRLVAYSFHLQNVIHWVKSISLDNSPCRGHVKPINSQRYLNDAHEFIFHFTKSGDVRLDKLSIGVPFADESNLTRGSRGKSGNVRDRGNVWFIPYPTRNTSAPHPCAFPVQLPLNCIKLHGVALGMTVLDPFCGTGATGVAAMRVGARFIGIDTNSAYLAEASRRLREQG